LPEIASEHEGFPARLDLINEAADRDLEMPGDLLQELQALILGTPALPPGRCRRRLRALTKARPNRRPQARMLS
jgi:hypothetical protein